jgi:uncharacterized phage-associated protein
MYGARAIANFLLDLARQVGRGLTPMQVLKLVYFAHGWHLAITGQPLIDERVQAWEYGPVIPSVYHAFKKYGNNAITAPAVDYEIPPGTWYSQGWPTPKVLTIDDASEDLINKDFTRKLLNRIWQSYGKFTGIQLSNMTHEPGSPWDVTRKESQGSKYAVISDELIKNYFTKQARGNGRTA